MKTISIISIVYPIMILHLTGSDIAAQDHYYYSRGEKNPLTMSTEKICIKFKSGIDQTGIQNMLLAEPELGELEPLHAAEDFFIIPIALNTSVYQFVQRLSKRLEVDILNPVYLIKGVTEVIVYDRFVVQFMPYVTTGEIETFNQDHHVEVVHANSYIANRYVLRVTSTSDLSVVEMANRYYEDPLTAYSHADFIMKVELHDEPNDTYFPYQYYFHNTGQTGGETDADIDAPQAWDITTGSASIVVAVLDDGVAAHEDLPLNRLVILPGSDFFLPGDDDPSPNRNDAHGMACAGIIAASQNNNTGITGLAPKCKIMPIRIASGNLFASSVRVADAIHFAWQNGADVLSNSWGYPETVPWDDDVAAAIDAALTQGRDGLGCVVVFAAGNSADRTNNDYGFVAFPANVPGVLAVGATDKSNNIQNYSPRDDEIDVVAPSGGLANELPTVVCFDERDWHERMELRGDVWFS